MDSALVRCSALSTTFLQPCLFFCSCPSATSQGPYFQHANEGALSFPDGSIRACLRQMSLANGQRGWNGQPTGISFSASDVAGNGVGERRPMSRF